MKKLLLIILTALLSTNIYAQLEGLPQFRGKTIQGSVYEWDTFLKTSCTPDGQITGTKYYKTKMAGRPAIIQLKYAPTSKKVASIVVNITASNSSYFDSYNVNNYYNQIISLFTSSYGEPHFQEDYVDLSTYEGRKAFQNKETSMLAMWVFTEGYTGMGIMEMEYCEYIVQLEYLNAANYELYKQEMAKSEF